MNKIRIEEVIISDIELNPEEECERILFHTQVWTKKGRLICERKDSNSDYEDKREKKQVVPWISVKDEVPMHGIPVLCYAKGGLLSMFHYKRPEWCVWRDNEEVSSDWEITHWIELSEIPKP